MAEVATHAEMQNERATIIKRDNQILAAPMCVDERAPSQPVCECPSRRPPDDVWSGNDYSLDALSESGSPEVLELGFYFWKLRHISDP